MELHKQRKQPEFGLWSEVSKTESLSSWLSVPGPPLFRDEDYGWGLAQQPAQQVVTRGSSSDGGLPLRRLGHGQVLSEASLEATWYRSNRKALLSWKKKGCCP